MIDGTLSKLKIILKLSKISLKEIRSWERERLYYRISKIAMSKFWLYERILHDAKSRNPHCLISYYSN